MSDLITADDFAPYVGRPFHCKGGLSIALQAVQRHKRTFPGAKRDPFILIFRAPKGETYMREGLYETTIEDGPSCTLYLSPIQTLDAAFQDYQSVFG